jgi:hypothetical protein
MKSKGDLERKLDLAAELALRTRERIEAGVNTGEVPSWIIDACNVLERASLQYGELAAQIKPEPEIIAEAELGGAPLTMLSLTVH